MRPVAMLQHVIRDLHTAHDRVLGSRGKCFEGDGNGSRELITGCIALYHQERLSRLDGNRAPDEAFLSFATGQKNQALIVSTSGKE
jgi:hypothetical protein